jgi:RalA-binding protein 1
MTLRNIGIVFSPTLGIPAGIFYELVSRFGAIFDDEGVEELPLDEVVPTPAAAAQTVAQAGTGTGLGTSPGAGAGSGAGSATDNGPVAGPNSSPGGGALSVDEGTRNKRNSVLYHASGADAMLGLAGRALDPSNEDAQSEVSLDDIESEQMSAQSSDGMSLSLEKAGAGNANAVHETAA